MEKGPICPREINEQLAWKATLRLRVTLYSVIINNFLGGKAQYRAKRSKQLHNTSKSEKNWNDITLTKRSFGKWICRCHHRETPENFFRETFETHAQHANVKKNRHETSEKSDSLRKTFCQGYAVLTFDRKNVQHALAF